MDGDGYMCNDDDDDDGDGDGDGDGDADDDDDDEDGEEEEEDHDNDYDYDYDRDETQCMLVDQNAACQSTVFQPEQFMDICGTYNSANEVARSMQAACFQ